MTIEFIIMITVIVGIAIGAAIIAPKKGARPPKHPH